MTTTIGSSTSNPLSSVDVLSQVDATVQTQLGQSVSGTTSTTGGPSDFASILNQLQQLQQSDPAKFREVTQNVADALKTDASNATGSQAQALTSMADRFEQASQTGTMTPLKPSGSGHHGGGHHHHSGVQAYGQQQGQSTDPLAALLQSDTSDSSSTGSGTQQSAHMAQIVQDALNET